MTMKNKKQKENWQSKRIDEINKICSAKPSAADCFIDEVNDIYESKADSYESFKQEQEEKRAKYMPQLIKEWRNLK